MLDKGMFRKKRKLSDPELGSLVFSGGYWCANADSSSFTDISISIEGDDRGPQPLALAQAKSLIDQLPELAYVAESYFASVEVSNIELAERSLALEGISSHSVPGKFDLEFGLETPSEYFVIVHFREHEPFEVSLGD